MECSCHSKQMVKNGKYKDYQKYRCRNCGRQFSERSFSFFCRSRYPEQVITQAVLYTPFVSTRNSVFLIKETLQFAPSHVSIYNWMKKFAFLLKGMGRSMSFSNIWHVDEKFVKVKGCKDFAYLWVVLDDKNSMIAVHVSAHRNISGAQMVLELAKVQAEKPPDILVTDGLSSYIKACRKVFGRATRHVVAHFAQEKFMHRGKYFMLSNNRIESLNSKINLWYKKFRGFKRLDMANLWCNMWMHFYNFMRPRAIPHETISIHQVLR